MASSTLSLTSPLDGVDVQLHAQAALPPGRTAGTHFEVAGRAPELGLDGCGKSCPHRDLMS